jgi:enterochelin esterase-like enzyme
MPKDTYERVFAHLFGPGLEGSRRVNEHYQKNSVLKLVGERSVDELKKVRYWVDCGDDDFLTVGNTELHIALRKKQIPHEYRVREEAHNWTYWRTGLVDAWHL